MNNLDRLVDYFRSNEKSKTNINIGVEFEHLLLNSKAEARSYYDPGGTGDLFTGLVQKGWEPTYEGENILFINKDGVQVSTEPGGQIEFSTQPMLRMEGIGQQLIDFYRDALEVLEGFDSDIYSLGFQPRTNVDDIKILPMKRYHVMYDYFKKTGSMGRLMMKGTASIQVSLDYLNEYDYGRKYSLANKLSNILYCLFDNVAFKDNRPIDVFAFRSLVWNNTDRKRAGNFAPAFREDFSYEAYAKYLLGLDAIFRLRDGVFGAYDGTIDQALTGAKQEEMEHLLTMVFPDVRTKNFIEIRQIDSLPYPYNLGAVALLKAIFYNEENMDRVYNLIGDLTFKESERARLDMYKKGPKAKMMGRSFEDWGVDILSALDIDKEDQAYIRKIIPLMEGNTLRRQAQDSWEKYAMVENVIKSAKVDGEVLNVQ